MNKKEQLIAAGEAAYGKSWKTALSNDLGVSRQRIRQWLKDERLLPDLSDDLFEILNNRRKNIEQVQEIIKQDS